MCLHTVTPPVWLWQQTQTDQQAQRTRTNSKAHPYVHAVSTLYIFMAHTQPIVRLEVCGAEHKPADCCKQAQLCCWKCGKRREKDSHRVPNRHPNNPQVDHRERRCRQHAQQIHTTELIRRIPRESQPYFPWSNRAHKGGYHTVLPVPTDPQGSTFG